MIGAGKMELFHLISHKGSIRAAALSMGMSTKRATLLLKTIQEAFPIPILEKKLGNKGTKITPFGEELLKRYLDLCNHLSKESENFSRVTFIKIYATKSEKKMNFLKYSTLRIFRRNCMKVCLFN